MEGNNMATELIRSFAPTERYLYDFKLLTYEKGWAQVDTRQDASYYGTWTNPTKREIFNYCEGDICLTKCDTDEDYRQAVSEMVEWNKNAGYWLGIDPGFSAEMKDRFASLGFSDLLH
jgi:hypothetical protein